MPLIKREVEPVFVSQVDIGKDISNELECVSNFTLASIIRQLGNLSKHAEDIFGDLFQESMSISARASNIQNRMDAISRTVSQMDPLKDTVSMRDINTRINFKSGLIMDTKVVSSPTMPSAMKETYERCQKPPPLNLLSKYREDDKEALKFYTDPKFFFERWLTEQKKDMKKKKKRMKRPVSNIGKGPTKVVKTRKAGKGRGKELDDIERERQQRPKSTRRRQPQEKTGEHEEEADQEPPDASKPLENGEAPEGPLQDPPPPPPQLAIGDGGDFNGPSPSIESYLGDLPMPPPPPPPPPSEDLLPPPPSDPSEALYSDMDSLIDASQAFPQPPSAALPGNVAPPPPPLPPDLPTPNQRAGPAPPAPPPIPAFIPNPVHIDRTSKIPEPITVVQDTRDDLLSAIKQGMKLRKVDVNTEKQRTAEPEANSVEAILRRRIAMEVSSDEETSSTFSSDDSEWEDEDD